MVIYLVKRVMSAILLTVIVTLLTFVSIYSNGPAIARSVVGNQATDEIVQRKVTELGLDQPVLLQYFSWLGDLLRGDLGQSFYTGEPITAMISNRLPITLSLVGISIVLTALLSILVGVSAAVYGGWIDRTLQFIAVAGGAVPSFILAIGLVSLFAISFRWFPATGYAAPAAGVGPWLSFLILPVLSVLIGAVGGAAQQFRGAVSDVLRQDFVRTLRSRGIPEPLIIFRHVLRSAASPGLTILGLQTIALLGGVVIIEQIFAMQGIGTLTVSASIRSDVPAIMGCVLFTIVVVVVVNLAAELINGAVNPKARIA